ncbi:hypothetical protein OAU25_01050 [Crocinitomicaceae bacterium]|nr:hypothetical protein [Crocinitomicaceae bacterium]
MKNIEAQSSRPTTTFFAAFGSIFRMLKIKTPRPIKIDPNASYMYSATFIPSAVSRCSENVSFAIVEGLMKNNVPIKIAHRPAKVSKTFGFKNLVIVIVHRALCLFNIKGPLNVHNIIEINSVALKNALCGTI